MPCPCVLTLTSISADTSAFVAAAGSFEAMSGAGYRDLRICAGVLGVP
jgi:hypothetical protein